MILSREAVEELVLTKRLIHPFDPSRMGPSSYDLTVGEEYYLYREGDGKEFRPSTLGVGEPSSRFTIPPNACAFILTAEMLNMPTTVVGQVSLRFSMTKRGLMLSPQAPIDPGYSGRVMMMLYNLSDKEQEFKRGDPFVTINFHQLSAPTRGYRGANQGITTIEGFMPGRTPVLSSMTKTEEALKKRLDQYEKSSQRNLLMWLTLVALTLAIATLLATLLPVLAGYARSDEAPSNVTTTTPGASESPAASKPVEDGAGGR